MSHPAAHQLRADYPDAITALQDAQRVADDLLAAMAGQVVVPVDRIEFLARRTRALVTACIQVEQATHQQAAHP